MPSARKMLTDIIEPTVEKQYGGGLDDAYMTLSERRRRSSAFADPNATSAFANGGLPTVYRYFGGQAGEFAGIMGEPTQEEAETAAEQAAWADYYYGDPDASSLDPNRTDLTPGQKSEGTLAEDTDTGEIYVQPPQTKSITSLAKDPELEYSDEERNEILVNIARARTQDEADRERWYESLFSSKLAPAYIDQRSVRDIPKEDLIAMQGLIDRPDAGGFYGIGSDTANMLERLGGLRTFGKGLRSGLESIVPGRAQGRYNFRDPGAVDAPEHVKQFDIEFQNAKPGETLKDVADRFERDTGMKAPLEWYGFQRGDEAMNTRADAIAESINQNRISGFGKGLGLLAGLVTGNPLTFVSGLTSTYTGKKDAAGRPVSETVLDKTWNTLKNLVGGDKDTTAPEFKDKEEAKAFMDKSKTQTQKDIERDAKANQTRWDAAQNLAKDMGIKNATAEQISNLAGQISNVNSKEGLASIAQNFGKVWDILNNPGGALVNLISKDREPSNYLDTLKELEEKEKKDAAIVSPTDKEAMTNKDPKSSIQQQISSKLSLIEAYKANMGDDKRSDEELRNLINETEKEIEQLRKEDSSSINTQDLEGAEKLFTDTVRGISVDPKIVTTVTDTIKEEGKGNIISDVVTGIGNFFSGLFKGDGTPVTEDPTDLGPQDEETGLRQIQRKPTQEQIITVVTEVAKTPKKVQDTLFKKGLLYQYLALINAGYTAEKAMKAVGAEEGTPLGGSEETALT